MNLPVKNNLNSIQLKNNHLIINQKALFQKIFLKPIISMQIKTHSMIHRDMIGSSMELLTRSISFSKGEYYRSKIASEGNVLPERCLTLTAKIVSKDGLNQICWKIML